LAQADANRANVPWVVVTGHKPMYTANTNHQSELIIRESIEPLLLQYHVDLAIWGHNHCYERTYPVNATRVQNSQTKIYNTTIAPIHFVVGSAGQSLYSGFQNPPPAWSLVRQATFGYSRFHIDSSAKSLQFQFIRTDESVGDEFWICKTAKCPATFSTTVKQNIIEVGSSWKFGRVDADSDKLHGLNAEDSSMMTAHAPFTFPATTKTPSGGYYFRKTFDLSEVVEPVKSLSISVAAENKTVVYLNGELVDSGNDDPEQDYPYWNAQFFVDINLVNRLTTNVISVYMPDTGDKAFFDMEVFIVKERCTTGSFWNEETQECI